MLESRGRKVTYSWAGNSFVRHPLRPPISGEVASGVGG